MKTDEPNGLGSSILSRSVERMNMDIKSFIRWLHIKDGCGVAVDWCVSQEGTAQQLWDSCERPSWMLFVLSKIKNQQCKVKIDHLFMSNFLTRALCVSYKNSMTFYSPSYHPWLCNNEKKPEIFIGPESFLCFHNFDKNNPCVDDKHTVMSTNYGNVPNVRDVHDISIYFKGNISRKTRIEMCNDIRNLWPDIHELLKDEHGR